MSVRPLKLLFLAYPFPPSPAIGGVRAWCMAKYLSRLGWRVTVVTPAPAKHWGASAGMAVEEQCGKERISRAVAGEVASPPHDSPTRHPRIWLKHTARLLLRRLLRLAGMGLEECWMWSCLRTTAQLKPGDHDLVLATGSPFSTFFAARRIARRLEIPYVLDYRDPWSLSVHCSRMQKWMIRPLERWVLRDAAATLAVSASLAESQAETFHLSRPPIVISNGYDPEQLEDVAPTVFPCFAVVYAGNFYTGQREIDPVVRAIKRVSKIKNGRTPPIRLHYYGSGTSHVQECARRHGAEDLVECHGRVPRAESLSAIRGAGAVVVITSIKDRVGTTERGIVTGKLFEPLGFGVPILLVAPEGSDAAVIVEESGAGRSFRVSQVEAMARWLVDCTEGKSGRRFDPPPAYSWPTLAQRMDEVLAPISTRDQDAAPGTLSPEMDAP